MVKSYASEVASAVYLFLYILSGTSLPSGQMMQVPRFIALLSQTGRTFTLPMDESADIVWSESIKIKEGETKYHGDWTYKIETNNADGRYSFSIRTY